MPVKRFAASDDLCQLMAGLKEGLVLLVSWAVPGCQTAESTSNQLAAFKIGCVNKDHHALPHTVSNTASHEEVTDRHVPAASSVCMCAITHAVSK